MKTLKQLKEEIKILGYYQLIGGLIGVGFVIFQLIGLGSTNSDLVAIIIMIILLFPYILSIYAGNQCLKDSKNQLSISKINQALQVISFNLGGIGFTYHSGIYFSLGINTTDEFLFISNFGLSTINFQLSSSSEISFILINLIAFYLVYRIGIYENRIEEINEIMGNDRLDLDEHLITKE